MEYQTIARPGYLGKDRNAAYEKYDSDFGKGNWRIMWRWQGFAIPFADACKVYQDAYLQDSYSRPQPWAELRQKAKEVFDLDESDRLSGLDYLVQNNRATHIQDIAIRNVFKERGWDFEGTELIQVRKHSTYFGSLFSPGKIRFHEPQKIVLPHLAGWWDADSVEDFYQSNKVLQIKGNIPYKRG